ncbi:MULTISPECIES: PstS family phosphate ABC transporter substrate-binding protein [Bacillaceae]|uniref:Substrate-binding domain-containing protein n=1 Tax=Evansella alkalicola TaxID=745819 RepID=A0ABS6K0J3_9BACI|nr:MULTISPECIES: substrate-binding domain-containing protein [Bacillaceae]MBU9722880.1 substrate-binding domain-containing protein [Bacillus alkalicola]
MKTTSVGVRVVYVILFSGLIVFGGFVTTIITLLAGLRQDFYVPFIITTCIGLIVFFIINQFQLLKKRLQKISVGIFAGVIVIALSANIAYEVYIDNLEMVKDTEVDLMAYEPFKEGSNVARLDGPASLQLADENLPRLDGATALYPVYAAFVQATYPEKLYDPYGTIVMSTKTGGAYENLVKGEVDIIFAAGPSAGQQRQADLHGVELEMIPIGREAFVFFVNARNPVEGLTIEEIQNIYAGDITSWSEVGGDNDAIRAFQRPEGSGSQTALENLMGDIPLMTPPTEDIVGGMGGIISETSNYKNYRNALGYSFRYYSTEMVQDGGIKHLAVNGVYPSKETIRSGEYPIASEFYAITAGSDNPHIDEFIEWILSEEGQELIEKTGYVPIK